MKDGPRSIIIGLLVSVVGGLVVWFLTDNGEISVTITGPSRATVGIPFFLVGSVKGAYDQAYWTNSRGNTLPVHPEQRELFRCIFPGSFTVTLTVETDDETIQEKHDIQCFY